MGCRWKKCNVLIGLILLNIPISLPSYYGNLSTYIDSYFISKEGVQNHQCASLWPISLFLSTFSLSITGGSFLSKKIGPWLTTWVGAVSLNVSLYITYFSVQYSFTAMTFTFAVCTGISNGMICSMTILYASVFFPENVALASATGSSGTVIGASFINHVFTFFINPQNKQATLRTENSNYFSDEDILSRVPYVFLVLGLISTGCQTVALPLLRNHPSFFVPKQSEENLERCEYHVEEAIDDGSAKYNETVNILQSRKESDDDSTPSYCRSDCEKDSDAITQQDLTPFQLLKSPTFYKMALSLTLLILGFGVDNNFYKQFGIAYINDDYFLTSVGLCLGIMNFVGRIVWGAISDRIGPKPSIAIVSSLHTIMTAFWFFSPMVSKWLFLFWTVIEQAIITGTFSIFTVLTLEIFGRNNYVANYGILCTCGIPLNIVFPPLSDIILDSFGFFYLFLCISVCSFISFLLNLSLF